jgi:uncharacterized damage-inducible protein DinB
MSDLEQLRRLWEHAAWADLRLLDALQAAPEPPPAAIREYAHVLGAAEVWLARLEQREPRAAVWPEATLADAAALGDAVRAGYARYLAQLAADDLPRAVAYTNSAGQHFATAAGDILLQVALHGQYHRGKVNLLLRQAGLEPAPADYISFVRGVPAATERSAAAAGRGGAPG